MNDGFVERIGVNPFSRILVKPTIGLKPAAITKYNRTDEYRSFCLKLIWGTINFHNPGVSHADIGSTRSQRNKADEEKILEESRRTNNFDHDPSDIVSLSTGNAAPVDVAKNLLEDHTKSTTNFKSEMLQLESRYSLVGVILTIKLKTFSGVIKTTNKNKTEGDHLQSGQDVVRTDVFLY